MNSRDLPVIACSQALYARAQTLAKGPGQFVRGVAPLYLARGRGARVTDVDGNAYLDYSMAVGPLSLGYCYPAVDAVIRAQLEDGITFSLGRQRALPVPRQRRGRAFREFAEWILRLRGSDAGGREGGKP